MCLDVLSHEDGSWELGLSGCAHEHGPHRHGQQDQIPRVFLKVCHQTCTEPEGSWQQSGRSCPGGSRAPCSLGSPRAPQATVPAPSAAPASHSGSCVQAGHHRKPSVRLNEGCCKELKII